jgi:hypothetical protein
MSASSVAAPVALHVKYLLLPLFSAVTGYTVKACQRKIETGVWREGQHYRRSPDGRIHMDLEEYQKWVEASMAA